MSQDNSYFSKIEQLLDKTGLLSSEDKHLIIEIRKEAELADDKDPFESEVKDKASESSSEGSAGASTTTKSASIEDQIFLNVSSDCMEALLTISPLEGSTLTRNLIEKRFEAEGIRSGILWDEVESCIQRVNAGSMVTGDIVAVGKHPVEGKNAHVNYYFEHESKKSRLSSSRKSKKFNSKAVTNVGKSRLIAEKIPMVAGTDGVDIYAKVLSCQEVHDIPLIPGENTTLDDQGRLFSLAEGKPRIEKSGRVSVIPIYTIEGDLDISTGNIKFDGNIEVLGNVMSGLMIEAGGDIYVRGGVDGSKLVSNGSMFINGGFTGGKRGFLKVGGDCYVGHCNTGTIEVAGDLYVEKEILNAQIYTSGHLKFESKGALIGGQIFVGKNLEAYNIGSNFGITTHVFMGQKELINRRLKKAYARKREREKQIDLIQRSIHKLKLQKNIMDQNFERNKQILLQLVEGQNIFHKDLSSLHDEIKNLKELKSRFTVHFVRIAGSVFPGTKLSIGESVHVVERRSSKIEFYEDPTNRSIVSRFYSSS